MWVTVLSFFRDAAKQREEDERKRKISERQKKRDTVEKRCAQKAKKYLSSDRLKLDKQYLNGLSRGIGPKPGLDVDDVELGIAENAYEALFFLKGREEFWRQVAISERKKPEKSDEKSNNNKKNKK